jgi:hypothetical protein
LCCGTDQPSGSASHCPASAESPVRAQHSRSCLATRSPTITAVLRALGGGASITLRDRLGPAVPRRPGSFPAPASAGALGVQARHDATPLRFSRISIARCTDLARFSASSGVLCHSQSIAVRVARAMDPGPGGQDVRPEGTGSAGEAVAVPSGDRRRASAVAYDPRAVRRLEVTAVRHDPCRIPGAGRAADVPGLDDQITWLTATRTAPDLACVIPVCYSVSRGG